VHVSRLGLLAKVPNHEFVVPEHVIEEITSPEQRAALDAAICDGWLKVEIISDLGAITVFTELLAPIGRAEAACIAIAAKEGWHIASDEKSGSCARPRPASELGTSSRRSMCSSSRSRRGS
jgi:predicted nucleic acid-binding protein